MMIEYGTLKSYIDNEQVTDINYNGRDVWIDHLTEGRICTGNHLHEREAMNFCIRLSNLVNKVFNPITPVLECEIDHLRISCIHPVVAGELCISIRKTPPCIRIDEEQISSSKFLTKSSLDFLKKAVRANCNIIISGLPGSGKTEIVKFLLQYVQVESRVVTIEDTVEIRLNKIMPHLDSVSLSVSEHFGYEQAIKTSLRIRPDWLCFSEVRSSEVYYLLQTVSTGTHLMSTIHAHSALQIPQRLTSIYPMQGFTEHQIVTTIHQLVDIGIHVQAKVTSLGVVRKVTQICSFDVNEDQQPISYTHYDGKRFISKNDNKKLQMKLQGGGFR